MEETTEVRSIDVSVLISDQKDDTFQNDSCGVEAALQSDRGPWQLSHWMIFVLTALFCSWHIYSPAFLVPDSDCAPAALGLTNESSSTESIMNSATTSSPKTLGSIHSMKNCFSKLVTVNCSTRSYAAASFNGHVIVKCTPVANDESGYTPRKAFYGTKHHIAVTKAVYMLGSFVAAMLISFAISRFGRRRVLFGGFLMFYVCVVAASFTSSMDIFLALRFFLSLGLSAVYWITLQAMLESVVPDYRLLYGTMGHVGWAVGYMILPVVAWCTPDWHSFQASISIPCLLLAIPLCFVPESINYLLRRGHMKEAVDLLKAALKKNGRNIDDVSEVCHQSHRNFMKRSHNSEKNVCLKLKAHLGYRKILFYCSEFVMSLLYYIISWGFYQLPGDPFANFAWFGVMEMLAVLILVFGSFIRQRFLLFCMAIGASVFSAAGILVATGETGIPVHSYMAAKFFATGALVLTVIRAFEESTFLITAAIMSMGAAVAPLFDEMVVGDYDSTMKTGACIACLILAIISAIFPSHSTKCSLQNPVTSRYNS